MNTLCDVYQVWPLRPFYYVIILVLFSHQCCYDFLLLIVTIQCLDAVGWATGVAFGHLPCWKIGCFNKRHECFLSYTFVSRQQSLFLLSISTIAFPELTAYEIVTNRKLRFISCQKWQIFPTASLMCTVIKIICQSVIQCSLCR